MNRNIQIFVFQLICCLSFSVTAAAESRWPMEIYEPGIHGMVELGGYAYEVQDQGALPDSKTAQKRYKESFSKSLPLAFGEISRTWENAGS